MDGLRPRASITSKTNHIRFKNQSTRKINHSHIKNQSPQKPITSKTNDPGEKPIPPKNQSSRKTQPPDELETDYPDTMNAHGVLAWGLEKGKVYWDDKDGEEGKDLNFLTHYSANCTNT
jgi:hypothetical protein